MSRNERVADGIASSSQSTTSTTSPCPRMGTVRRQRLTRIRTSGARSLCAIRPSRRPARLVICRASTATSPSSRTLRSKPWPSLRVVSAALPCAYAVFRYYDLYASTKDGIGAFFGNRSIVVHAFNTTRLNCANFTLDTTGEQGGDVKIVPNATASAPAGSASPTQPGVPVFTGAASALSSMRLTSFAAVAGGLFAAFFLA